MESNKEKELATVKTAMTVLGYVISAIFIVLGLPLVLELIEPNSAYGVRTAQALSDENTWYHLNSIGGWGMIVSGLLSFLTIRTLKNNENLESVKSIVVISCIPALFPIVILGCTYLFMM
ncbi:SdpI family protein [Pseudoalteromonas tunicata]|uniref:SdpI family protein n=1 Tax=Pseudoalteromonas tunicata TaxID=314281 RepID=UPI00273F236D|nr:SdpI family protein [Pseudoalteromonas tunicata]